jgi:hypothetical protein
VPAPPEGDYAIYEYNGRYTGATGARQLLGYDEVGMGLEHFGGIRLPESPAPHAGRMRCNVCR